MDYLDAVTARAALAHRNEDIPELLSLIAAEPTKLRQIRYSSLASDYESIAWFSYALGAPLAEVAESLSQAVRAHLEVFELRGTEEAFPAYVLRYDPSFPPDALEATVEFKNVHEDREVDYSLTNSQKGYFAVCEALACCEDLVAGKIAALIWDPVDAAYIGPKSFCTRNDQLLGYALRQLLHGAPASVEAQLAQLELAHADARVRHQATMLWGLARGHRGSFVQGVAALLVCHEKQAASKKNRLNPEFFLCVAGLGLSRLGIQRGICALEDLPQRNAHLPLEMIIGTTGNRAS